MCLALSKLKQLYHWHGKLKQSFYYSIFTFIKDFTLQSPPANYHLVTLSTHFKLMAYCQQIKMMHFDEQAKSQNVKSVYSEQKDRNIINEAMSGWD